MWYIANQIFVNLQLGMRRINIVICIYIYIYNFELDFDYVVIVCVLWWKARFDTHGPLNWRMVIAPLCIIENGLSKHVVGIAIINHPLVITIFMGGIPTIKN